MTQQDGSRGPRQPISSARIAIWIAVGGIGLYLLVSGLIGALTAG